MTNTTRILLTATVSAIAALGVASIVVGDESPPPVADDIVPVVDVEPVPADWVPMYPDEALNDWQTDGYAVYGLETFPTLPQHDQCWRDDGGEILPSGSFVIFDDGRTWGTHSIGAMRCGPADTPQPAPAPEPATAVIAATEPACNP